MTAKQLDNILDRVALVEVDEVRCVEFDQSTAQSFGVEDIGLSPNTPMVRLSSDGGMEDYFFRRDRMLKAKVKGNKMTVREHGGKTCTLAFFTRVEMPLPKKDKP